MAPLNFASRGLRQLRVALTKTLMNGPGNVQPTGNQP
jgi:hypothetical protein